MAINPNNQELLDKFVKYLEIRVRNKTIRKSTSLLYINDIKQYLDYLDDINLGDVDEFKIDDFFNSLKGIKNDYVMASTKNRKIISLRNLYSYLFSRKDIDSNVMDHVELAEIKTASQMDDDEITEKEVLEKSEIKAFLKHLKKEAANPTVKARIPQATAKINALRDLAMFHLMIETGLRIGEVLSLELYQITTKISPTGSEYVNIHIPASKSKGGRKRDVPCSMTVLDEIDAYREAIPFESETVFLSKNGKPLDGNDTNLALKKYMEEIGVRKNITNHSLRHSFATHNSEILTPLELCSRMGHTDVKITMIYYHVSEESHCKILSF